MRIKDTCVRLQNKWQGISLVMKITWQEQDQNRETSLAFVHYSLGQDHEY